MRAPLVFDFQGSLTGEMLDHGFVEESGRGYQFWRWLEARIAHMPEAILTSSERGANLLRTEFSVPDDRIYPLPDCADLAHFAPNRLNAEEKGALRARLGIPDDRVVVAYLGLLANYQGTGHLIEAAAALKARGKPIHFLIMGYPNEDKYEALAQAYGVADYVTLTGRVNYREDAPGMLSLGDIAVSPKMSDTEGSGKVLNYMAMAQPVIAYDSPVHREYLGGAGVYVPLGDVGALAAAIEVLAADPERRSALGSSLRERAARHFSWSRAAIGIEELYLHLLQQNSVRIPGAY
jgi:glycosyltransferase involved in cell wall biosynthesis